MVGLGTVLLAIGIWKQPSAILEEFKKALPPTKHCHGIQFDTRWADVPAQKYWFEELKVICDVEKELGDKYRDIVVTCLLGDFGGGGFDPKNERLAEAFSKLVAERLDSILSS